VFLCATNDVHSLRWQLNVHNEGQMIGAKFRGIETENQSFPDFLFLEKGRFSRKTPKFSKSTEWKVIEDFFLKKIGFQGQWPMSSRKGN
jgi:hypothetical protein